MRSSLAQPCRLRKRRQSTESSTTSFMWTSVPTPTLSTPESNGLWIRLVVWSDSDNATRKRRNSSIHASIRSSIRKRDGRSSFRAGRPASPTQSERGWLYSIEAGSFELSVLPEQAATLRQQERGHVNAVDHFFQNLIKLRDRTKQN